MSNLTSSELLILGVAFTALMMLLLISGEAFRRDVKKVSRKKKIAPTIPKKLVIETSEPLATCLKVADLKKFKAVLESFEDFPEENFEYMENDYYEVINELGFRGKL